jgi:hypothetical protein
LEHWKQVQNNFNAQLQNELQNDGDEHIIFVVLVEQLGENMDEAHKSHGGSKFGHIPNVGNNREVNHIQFFHDYFAMQPIYSDKFFRCRFQMHR